MRKVCFSNIQSGERFSVEDGDWVRHEWFWVKQKSCYWGLDKSSSLSATGGVEQLLMIRDHSTGSNYFPIYDWNSSVTGLLDESGNIVAAYGYDPYGKIIHISGAKADMNPFGFSTKYTDRDTDLVYYGYRYYDPNIGRFINRDPIGEAGGRNLYAFVGNSPLNGVDVLGLEPKDQKERGLISVSEEERIVRYFMKRGWQSNGGIGQRISGFVVSGRVDSKRLQKYLRLLGTTSFTDMKGNIYHLTDDEIQAGIEMGVINAADLSGTVTIGKIEVLDLDWSGSDESDYETQSGYGQANQNNISPDWNKSPFGNSTGSDCFIAAIRNGLKEMSGTSSTRAGVLASILAYASNTRGLSISATQFNSSSRTAGFFPSKKTTVGLLNSLLGISNAINMGTVKKFDFTGTRGFSNDPGSYIITGQFQDRVSMTLGSHVVFVATGVELGTSNIDIYNYIGHGGVIRMPSSHFWTNFIDRGNTGKSDWIFNVTPPPPPGP